MATSTKNPASTPTASNGSSRPKVTATKATSTRRTTKTAATPEAGSGPAMTDEHKQSMRVGRQEGIVIAAYLEALEVESKRRRGGRRRTVAQLQDQLAAVTEALGDRSTKAIKRVQLAQERLDLLRLIEERSEEQPIDIEPLKAGFVEYAAGYSTRKKISWKAWREFGVPADVLRSAGLTPSS